MTCFSLPWFLIQHLQFILRASNQALAFPQIKFPLIPYFSQRKKKSDSQQDLKIIPILAKELLSLLETEHTANYQNSTSRTTVVDAHFLIKFCYLCTHTLYWLLSKNELVHFGIKTRKTDSMVLLAMKPHGSASDLLQNCLHFIPACLCITHLHAEDLWNTV